jgi:hypothetical protein
MQFNLRAERILHRVLHCLSIAATSLCMQACSKKEERRSQEIIQKGITPSGANQGSTVVTEACAQIPKAHCVIPGEPGQCFAYKLVKKDCEK